MSRKILEGMRDAYDSSWVDEPEDEEIEEGQLKAVAAALRWLAENIPDEVCYRAGKVYQTEELDARKYIRAALLEAAKDE